MDSISRISIRLWDILMVSSSSPRRTLILARLELKTAIAILSAYETTKGVVRVQIFRHDKGSASFDVLLITTDLRVSC